MPGLSGLGGLAGRLPGWGERLGRVWGGWEAVALPSTLACRELGALVLLFLCARFGGTGGGTGRVWAWKKGYVACWPGSSSRRSAGVCMFAFARVCVGSASFRIVSGGSVYHGIAGGLSSKGWWR